eukprot:m.600849 g.600849  ORF g.600849 m.600849 type:complete len:645 (+) comp22435_c0_seq3:90-2024(+)
MAFVLRRESVLGRAIVVLVLVASTQAAQKPHIVHVVGDDIGHNDFNFTYGTNDVTYAPNLEALATSGIVLSHFYTFKLCAPSRAMMMTGRYTFHFGYYDNVDASGPEGGVMLNYTLTPGDMKRAGYSTHGAGKWHCGFRIKEQTPTFRGFDSWVGYMHAEENYFTQMFGAANNPTDSTCEGNACCGVDLLQGDAANVIGPSKLNGTYSTYLYTQRVLDIIGNATDGNSLYMYLPFQNVHGPTEAPPFYSKHYQKNFPDLPEYRLRISACLSAFDEGIGKITDALKNAGMWENTVFFFNSDNGGDVGGSGNGMNNYPLRGGKWSHWEGGTRVVAFVHSELFPQHRRGTHWDGLMMSVDLRPTFARLGGVEPDNSGPFPLDGVDMWDALMDGSASPRNEIVYQVWHSPYCNKTCEPLNIGTKVSHVTNCAGAIRQGNYKLAVGFPGWPQEVHALPRFENETVPEAVLNRSTPTNTLRCNESPCLFDLSTDVSESNNIAEQNPDIVSKLLARLEELGSEGLPRRFTPRTDPRMCSAVERTGYWVPYVYTCLVSGVRCSQRVGWRKNIVSGSCGMEWDSLCHTVPCVVLCRGSVVMLLGARRALPVSVGLECSLYTSKPHAWVSNSLVLVGIIACILRVSVDFGVCCT